MYDYDIMLRAPNGALKPLMMGYDSYEEAEEDMKALCHLSPSGYVYEDGGWVWDVSIEPRPVYYED